MPAPSNTKPDSSLWFLNSRVEIRRPSADGPDGVSILEHTMPQGDSPPTHVHHNEDEIFHILEGQLRFRVGEVERVAGAGETLVAPKGVPHSFVVESPLARVLTIQTGKDFETAIRVISRAAEAPGLPIAAEPTSDMVTALAETFARHGIEIVGPHLAA